MARSHSHGGEKKKTQWLDSKVTANPNIILRMTRIRKSGSNSLEMLPRKRLYLHPLRFLSPGWRKTWPAWFDLMTASALDRRLDYRSPAGLSYVNSPMILWVPMIWHTEKATTDIAMTTNWVSAGVAAFCKENSECFLERNAHNPPKIYSTRFIGTLLSI